jgi:hypothetical protein
MIERERYTHGQSEAHGKVHRPGVMLKLWQLVNDFKEQISRVAEAEKLNGKVREINAITVTGDDTSSRLHAGPGNLMELRIRRSSHRRRITRDEVIHPRGPLPDKYCRTTPAGELRSLDEKGLDRSLEDVKLQPVTWQRAE